MHVECFQKIKPLVVAFVLLEADVTLDDDCGIEEHWHSFREAKCIQGLFQDFMVFIPGVTQGNYQEAVSVQDFVSLFFYINQESQEVEGVQDSLV